MLEAGRVTQTGTPEDVRRAPRTPYAAELVGVNLFTGRLVRLTDGAGQLVTTDGGAVIVPWPGGSDHTDDITATLQAADVSLHLRRPEGSARNVFEGRVLDVAIEGERARVRVDSRPRLVAEITRGSADRLQLAEGTPVWASFKAMEVRVLLPSSGSTGTLGG
jgi:molybdopterin-binding protein